MKKVLGIINIITISLVFIYVVFTKQFYLLVIEISYSANSVFSFSNFPYYLLIFDCIINIAYCIYNYIRNKTFQLNFLGVISIIILLCSFVFRAPYEFLQIEDERMIIKSYRYDNLFVYNRFQANEYEYDGDFGISKYLYIPFNKKIVYIDIKNGIRVFDYTYAEDIVKIDNIDYEVHNYYYTES